MRRRRGQVDEEEEGIDFSQFEQKPESENEKEATTKSAGDDAKQTRVPSGKKLAEQEVASLDNASLKGRRRNRIAEDEGEDLDAMLKSTGGGDRGRGRGDGGTKGNKREGQGTNAILFA